MCTVCETYDLPLYCSVSTLSYVGVSEHCDDSDFVVVCEVVGATRLVVEIVVDESGVASVASCLFLEGILFVFISDDAGMSADIVSIFGSFAYSTSDAGFGEFALVVSGYSHCSA